MNQLVLWGHHLDDYQEMFDVTKEQCHGRILEFGCGVTAVNAELKGLAKERVSVDALFCLDEAALKAKASLVFNDMLQHVTAAADAFDFRGYGSLDALAEKRQEGMATFFKDYPQGKKEGRYVGLTDVDLPFSDFQFDIAFSSHHLFSRLEGKGIPFHLKAIKQLARVAKEVRIFPLIDGQGNLSPDLGPVILDLQQHHYGVELRSVAYGLQPKGNAMLRVWAQACALE